MSIQSQNAKSKLDFDPEESPEDLDDEQRSGSGDSNGDHGDAREHYEDVG